MYSTVCMISAICPKHCRTSSSGEQNRQIETRAWRWQLVQCIGRFLLVHLYGVPICIPHQTAVAILYQAQLNSSDSVDAVSLRNRWLLRSSIDAKTVKLAYSLYGTALLYSRSWLWAPQLVDGDDESHIKASSANFSKSTHSNLYSITINEKRNSPSRPC